METDVVLFSPAFFFYNQLCLLPLLFPIRFFTRISSCGHVFHSVVNKFCGRSLESIL